MDLVLSCNERGVPRVCDEEGNELWLLEKYTYGAASLLIDAILEDEGYGLCVSSGLRWTFLDA